MNILKNNFYQSNYFVFGSINAGLHVRKSPLCVDVIKAVIRYFELSENT